MKKKLLLCSLLCLLAAATSVAASNNLADPAAENTTTETSINASTATPTVSQAEPDTPSEDSSDHSLTRLNLFGDPIGIYHIDWKFELTKVSTPADQPTTDGDYIDESSQSTDQSMMLNVTLPLGENGDAIQLQVGLDFQQANAVQDDANVAKPDTETTTPAATTTTAPITTTTAATTTTVPTTKAPETEKPVTTPAPTTPPSTTAAPTTKAPETTAPKSNEVGAVPETAPAYSYTEEEYDLLCRIIHCEAGGEKLEGMIAVGTVIMNRVESSKFPNSIEGVLFQKGQFPPATSGKIYRITPNAKSCEAARRVLEGERTDSRILYFRSSKYASQPWMNGKRTLIITIDKQSFYS